MMGIKILIDVQFGGGYCVKVASAGIRKYFMVHILHK